MDETQMEPERISPEAQRAAGERAQLRESLYTRPKSHTNPPATLDKVFVAMHARLGKWSRAMGLRRNQALRGDAPPMDAEWASACEEALHDLWDLAQACHDKTPAGKAESELHLQVLDLVLKRGSIQAGEISHLDPYLSQKRNRTRLFNQMRAAGWLECVNNRWQVPGRDNA